MTQEIIAITSTIIALASAVASGLFARRSLKAQQVNQAFALRQQYYSDLRKWADEGCNILSKTVYLCDNKPETLHNPGFAERVVDLREKLSAMIDRGRWFFPNVGHDEFGLEKEEAFRGHRQPVLNSLHGAYTLLGKLDDSDREGIKNIRKELVKVKRKFVTEIQIKLDPRTQERNFSEMMTV